MTVSCMLVCLNVQCRRCTLPILVPMCLISQLGMVDLDLLFPASTITKVQLLRRIYNYQDYITNLLVLLAVLHVSIPDKCVVE